MIDVADAGSLLVAGLPGPELGPEVEGALRDLAPAGVILFARNIRGPGQVKDLLAGVREVVGRPVLAAVDQEGGPVNRLGAIATAFAKLPAGRLQATWPEERLDEVWFHAGRAMAALGFNVDFAPVADLDDGPGTNAIGPRSYGTDPARVAACASLVLGALARAGVAGCLKHFPGLGGTDLDTHKALATSPLTLAEITGPHVRPYRDLVREAPLVMTAHAHFPALDGPEPLPATFSPRALGALLREEIGYDGVVISDDLEMGAVAREGSPGARALRALAAGCDLALFCHDLDVPRRARDELAAAAQDGRLDGRRVDDSVRRRALLLAHVGTAPPPPSFEDACEALEARLATLQGL